MATAWSTIPTFTAGSPALTAAQMNIVGNDLKLAGDRPSVFVARTAAQSIGTGTDQIITFPVTEVLNNDTMHSSSVNTGQFKCVTPGYYLVSGAVSFTPVSSSNPFTVYVQKYTNASSTLAVVAGSAGSAAPHASTLNQLGFVVRSNTCIVKLAVDDYVALYAYHEHGSSLNTYEGGGKGQSTTMLVQWVAPS